MLGDPLAAYLADIERYATLPWPDRDRLLVLARDGDEAAKKALIEATLTVAIDLECAPPGVVQDARALLPKVKDDSWALRLATAVASRLSGVAHEPVLHSIRIASPESVEVTVHLDEHSGARHYRGLAELRLHHDWGSGQPLLQCFQLK